MPNPQFPLYIVSKGRWEKRHTSKTLDAMRVPYYIIVEEQEYVQYKDAVEPQGFGTVLVLDPAYQRDYDTCDALGDTKSKGPGPARNFAWEHSNALGAARHWVMDDNIQWFYRFNRNVKSLVKDGVVFRIMEDFCLRYVNVAMAGPNYEKFAPKREDHPAFALNTRIYSCNLILNALSFRWRGRYNEDTDLSLRILKAGLCTVQFNAFLQGKMTTQTVRGGNTDAFYIREGTLAKSQMQMKLHPDVSRVVFKFSRWHHQVDYRPFKNNQLVRAPDAPDIPNEIDEYGLVLRSTK